MHFHKIAINPKAKQVYNRYERVTNMTIRDLDTVRAWIGLRGRTSHYDDENYEFVGGAKDELRAKHYDKSLRFLWKAETNASWSSFRDATRAEKDLLRLAENTLDAEERKVVKKMRTEDFKALLDREYSPREKQAMVNVLSLIGHGEAYAWMVSNSLLGVVRSTGGKAAVTMQVLEEAKHFVVLRELVKAFDCPVPRMSAWEYFLMERILKMDPIERFFGMNVVVEGFALSLFGMLAEFPGMEILKLFHRDESRHTALPGNYLKEFPMSVWQKNNPANRVRRFSLILPAVPIVYQVEEDLAELGIDSLEFGGAMARKILHLANRVGYYQPLSDKNIGILLNFLLNRHATASRDAHKWRNYLDAETTLGADEKEVEAEVFQLAN